MAIKSSSRARKEQPHGTDTIVLQYTGLTVFQYTVLEDTAAAATSLPTAANIVVHMESISRLADFYLRGGCTHTHIRCALTYLHAFADN